MAKKAKNKLPKTIGGVKVPKQLRKAGDKAVRLAADHPVISDLVAAALLAAAAALADGKTVRAGLSEAGEKAGQAKRKAGRARAAAKAAATALGAALLDEIGSGKKRRGNAAKAKG